MPDNEPQDRRPPVLPSERRERPARRADSRGEAPRRGSGGKGNASPPPGREQPHSPPGQPSRRDGVQTRPAERRAPVTPPRDGARSAALAPGRTRQHDYSAHDDGRPREPRGSRLEEIRSEKRDRFLTEQPARRKRRGWLYVGVPMLLVVLVGVAWFVLAGEGVGAKSGVGIRRSSGIFTPMVPENGVLKLPVADFQDGKARFYTYKTAADKEIDFYVLKSSDGVIRAAIDSCDVCFAYKKGYRQEGDEMVCNNCGLRFPSIKINVIKGGCNPAPLTRETQDDAVVIKEKDLIIDGDQYF